MIARSPTSHPSEIRLLKAVDRVAELGHLINVVVFSSKPSPDPSFKGPVYSLMGGGDLDGDVYWVCWDRDLIDDLKELHPS